MISALLVNAGNYLYNVLLGRILGPEQFADAAILITFLLVLSFAAMTFQLVTAKFSVSIEKEYFEQFIAIIYRYALIVGIVVGLGIVFFSSMLQEVFHTQSAMMFQLLGIGVPLYFIMSVNRGILQGKKKFATLAITYQGEMMSRLVLTLVLLFFLGIQTSLIIAFGITASLVCGLFPFSGIRKPFSKILALPSRHTKHIQKFFLLTAFYELTQIIINNSDILMVKHYFDEHQAGLYASLALIGRVVYFAAWMFVMLLLPKVVQLKKEGKPTTTVLLTYLSQIALLAILIVFMCYMFPEFIVNMMFGAEYLSIAPLLWKYAIATSLFAISNVFAYYFLSLDNYVPVVLSGILGVSQIALIAYFHDSLAQVVIVQMIAMLVLLVIQLIYFLGIGNNKT